MPNSTGAIREAAALLASVRIGAITQDAELLELTSEVERAGRLVDALRSAAAAEIARRSERELGRAGLAAREGFRTPTDLIASLTHVSGRQAHYRSRLGRLVAPLGELATALTEGSIGTDAAESIALALTPVLELAPPESVSREVAHLVAVAESRPADEVSLAARTARDRLDIEGVEQRERDLRAGRYLRFGREIDGLVPIRGMLPPEEAGVVLSLFDARTSSRRQPRFEPAAQSGVGAHGIQRSGGFVDQSGGFVDQSGGGLVDQSGDEPTDAAAPALDNRTMDQRRADTFVEICRIAAGTLTADAAAPGPSAGAGTLVVTMTLEQLESGIGAVRVDGVAEPISARSARRIACNAGILPLVLGGNNQPLDLGYSRRLFSTGQRRALGVLHPGCAVDGCHAPPGWTEAHHIVPWSRGGPTDLSNGILLCSFHHHEVHEDVLEVRVVDGEAQVFRPGQNGARARDGARVAEPAR